MPSLSRTSLSPATTNAVPDAPHPAGGSAGPGSPRVTAALLLWSTFVLVVWAVASVVDVPPAGAQAEQRGQQEQTPELDGEFLWRRDCASCHGPEGNGTDWGPSLQGRGPADVHLTVTTGRMPMESLYALRQRGYDPDELEVPAREVEYTPGQIAALVDYSREIIEGPDVPIVDVAGADASRGFELWESNCASCHVWSARGGALANGHVATSLATSRPENVVAAMRVGLGTMPAFPEEVISDEEAAHIAAYVEYLKQPRNEGGHPLAYMGPVAEGFAAWMLGIVGVLLITRWIGQRS